MYRSEPPAGDPERRAAREADGRVGEAALRLRWAELESRLGGGEWFAELFSAADIALFMMVLFAQRLHGPGSTASLPLPRGSPEGPQSGRRWHRPWPRLPRPTSPFVAGARDLFAAVATNSDTLLYTAPDGGPSTEDAGGTHMRFTLVHWGDLPPNGTRESKWRISA